MDRCLYASPCRKDSLHGCLQVGQKWNICPGAVACRISQPFRNHSGNQSHPLQTARWEIQHTSEAPCTASFNLWRLPVSPTNRYTVSSHCCTDSSLHTCYQSQAHMLRSDFCCTRSILFSTPSVDPIPTDPLIHHQAQAHKTHLLLPSTLCSVLCPHSSHWNASPTCDQSDTQHTPAGALILSASRGWILSNVT